MQGDRLRKNDTERIYYEFLIFCVVFYEWKKIEAFYKGCKAETWPTFKTEDLPDYEPIEFYSVELRHILECLALSLLISGHILCLGLSHDLAGWQPTSDQNIGLLASLAKVGV
jgi:hypothetical protein